MGRKVDIDHLVSASEIASRLGVRTSGVVHDWRRRYSDFPKPIARLALGFVWAWPDVAAWAKKTGRLS
jgi:hypothetical protein